MAKENYLTVSVLLRASVRIAMEDPDKLVELAKRLV